MDVLIGYISPQQSIIGSVKKFGEVTGEIKSDEVVIGVIEIIENPPEYDGSYEVTPTISEQTFDTSNKIMSQDFKVKDIPYSEVLNPSGGKTVTIG